MAKINPTQQTDDDGHLGTTNRTQKIIHVLLNKHKTLENEEYRNEPIISHIYAHKLKDPIVLCRNAGYVKRFATKGTFEGHLIFFCDFNY